MAPEPASLSSPSRSAPASLPVLIVTGLSGSGKSTVLRALEDVGYFCVDNLPLELLPPFLRMQPQEKRKIALGMDVRTQGFIQNYARVFKRLERQGRPLHILFLEAEEDVLIRRFSQTRRQHPLAEQEPIVQALRQEREALAGLRRLAQRVIDTSGYNIHQLRELIKNEYSDLPRHQRMWVRLMSFAYKNGIPPEADLVLDVRFLPNPYFVEELTALTGQDRRVQDYVLKQGETQALLAQLFNFIDFLLPRYQAEGKTQLTLALGCTGGQHRSVVIAQTIGEHLAQTGIPCTITHRDLPRATGA